MTEISITTDPTELVLTDGGGTELVIEVLGVTEIVMASFGPQGPAGPPGSGGIGAVTWDAVSSKPATFPPAAHSHDYASTTQGALADSAVQPDDLADVLAAKQDVLASGTNIKTVNGISLLGSGDLAITGASPLLGWFL